MGQKKKKKKKRQLLKAERRTAGRGTGCVVSGQHTPMTQDQHQSLRVYLVVTQSRGTDGYLWVTVAFCAGKCIDTHDESFFVVLGLKSHVRGWTAARAPWHWSLLMHPCYARNAQGGTRGAAWQLEWWTIHWQSCFGNERRAKKCRVGHTTGYLHFASRSQTYGVKQTRDKRQGGHHLQCPGCRYLG